MAGDRTALGDAMGGSDDGARDGKGGSGVAADPASRGHRVRDRDVVVLAAFCVAVVLGLQLLGIIFPPFDEALGRPPTMIVALIVVTVVVLGRALWASMRRG
jgi:hypothetical protein